MKLIQDTFPFFFTLVAKKDVTRQKVYFFLIRLVLITCTKAILYTSSLIFSSLPLSHTSTVANKSELAMKIVVQFI